MIYKSSRGDLDLSKITRLYPACVVEMYGDVAEMSLEWAEMNEDKVTPTSYILVFDFAPLGSEESNRVTLNFDTKDELMVVMQEVAEIL